MRKLKKIEDAFNWAEVLEGRLVDPFEQRQEGPKSTLHKQLLAKFSISLAYWVATHPKVRGNLSKTARILGISRTTLQKYLKSLKEEG